MSKPMSQPLFPLAVVASIGLVVSIASLAFGIAFQFGWIQ